MKNVRVTGVAGREREGAFSMTGLLEALWWRQHVVSSVRGAGWGRADRACLAVKILPGITCVPLIHSDGRSGGALF